MAMLGKGDFYYGAALSVLLSSKMNPVLVDENDDVRVFKIMYGRHKVLAFMKYRSEPNSSGSTWSFSSTKNERARLSSVLENNDELICMILVCGRSVMNKSEVVVLHHEEIRQIFESGNSISVSREKHRKKINVSSNGFIIQVDANRLSTGCLLAET